MIPVIDIVSTGQRIKEIRKASGISVRELQDILGLTNPQAIYKWQNGQCMPKIDNLVILSAVFDVTLDEMIVIEREGENEKDTNSI